MGSRGPAGSDGGKRRRQKETAAAALAAGKTTANAAAEAGVHERTVRHWRAMGDPEFARSLAAEERALLGLWSDAVPLVFGELLRRLRDPDQLARTPTRDLAGLAHLASQAYDRGRPGKPADDPTDVPKQPHTPADLDAILARVGAARLEKP